MSVIVVVKTTHVFWSAAGVPVQPELTTAQTSAETHAGSGTGIDDRASAGLVQALASTLVAQAFGATPAQNCVLRLLVDANPNHSGCHVTV